MKKAYFNLKSILILVSFLLISCHSTVIPDKAQAIENFDLDRYLGTWYEIARFDFRFERDLDNTSAQYSLDSEGNVIVLNSGFNVNKKKWEKAIGIAKFRGDQTVGALKVSFFGPFYSGYNIIALDEQYKYALIAGKDLDFLWILSREKSIPKDIRKEYLDLAQEIGYDISRLIWVEHNKSDNPYLK